MKRFPLTLFFAFFLLNLSAEPLQNPSTGDEMSPTDDTPTARWRLPDGSIVAPPETETVTATSAILRPGTEGVPVFALPLDVKANDVLSLRLRVAAKRTDADEGADGQGGVILSLFPASSKNNYNPDAEHRQIVIVGTQAENIRIAVRLGADYAAGELLLVPTLSYFDRTLVVDEIEWAGHGPEANPEDLTASTISYPGQEADAPWREKAAVMIESHRKADLRIRILDRWGEPVEGVELDVEQVRHAYPFGTALVGSRIVDAPREFSPESGMTTEQWLADNVRYRAELERNFNTVVFENELKWPQWSRAQAVGVHDQNWTLGALEWLREREYVVKGHTLVWGSWRFTPSWLREKEDEPEAIQRAALAHIRDIATATGTRTHYWDVLNEPMSHRNLIELLGTEKIVEWFQTAREALPGNRLVMNEFDLVGNGGNANRRANFLKFYQELHEAGAPLDVIGFQGHFWSDRFTAPEKIWEIIDEVHEATGLPLMISEFDTNFPNEQLQADYYRDFLTAWFAHPATEAFIMWGFWGGAHWMGDAGSMFRRDWSEKPNLASYRKLVYNDWWTRAILQTNAEGLADLRAFHGRHRITLTPAEGGLPITRTIDLPAEGRTVEIVMP
ncbi:MAG: endo-1,4-beta-xylanase [Kiritimatiellae bacterium]|nr:endo-1,4-beta-xylanase [Kiritimatiellia bacterium]